MENRKGHTDDINYFVGEEVEHTPMFGRRTLFVVGVQPVQEILVQAFNNNCPHIYLGANQSFDPDSEEELAKWVSMAQALLSNNIWVTLDFDIKHCEKIAFSGITRYNNFIAMISAKIPYIDGFNYNTMVKVDDIGFNKTNTGVWCHNLHDLQSRNHFTHWEKYTNDQVIKD